MKHVVEILIVIIFIIAAILFVYKSTQGKEQIQSIKEITHTVERKSILSTSENTIEKRFGLPEGYERIYYDEVSFERYLMQLPLKAHGEKVHYYDGREKPKNIYDAVVDFDLGNRDLQQCADSIIRLRAEYLYNRKKYKDINFNFTNGFNAEYEKWIQGYRIQVKNNDVKWEKSKSYDDSYENFKKYLDIVYSYAGTISLSKELIKVENIKEIKPGDIFIQGGSPGHAVIVVDVAINKTTNHKIFMLAQGYMPAQDIHILKNQHNEADSPWYSVDFGNELITPEWTFSKDSLRRF
ncbi:MAG TPA: hypothetical protein DEP72_05310 [Clostridiales bacterium]|nr:MAG: hypothetical protein A2Y18_08545 [Clostridiales bacterium GWD2_32_19]HCC07560.1 hypothetical protein [Clostridiales bacterium]